MPGEVVNLADRHAAARHRGAGWHAVEDWGCWSAGTRAELVFEPGLAIGGDAVFIAEARALTSPGAAFEARIMTEGEKVATWRLDDQSPRVLQAVIPARIAARATNLRISIECDAPVQVREVANAEDPRAVGLGISRLALALASEVADAERQLGASGEARAGLGFGQLLRLLDGGEAHRLVAGEWIARAGWGLTSIAPRPLLAFTLPGLPGRDAALRLRLRPVASAEAPLHLGAIAEGQELGEWTFASDAPADIVIPLPAGLRARADPLRLELVPHAARSPASLGLGAAAEAFGFGLIAAEAREAGAAGRPSRATLLPGDRLTLPAGEAPAWLGADWHLPDEEGCWSFGPTARLPLLLPGAEGGVLVAKLEVFRPGAAEAWVEASAGGAVLACRTVAPGSRSELAIAVPAGYRGPQGELDLTLAVEAAPSPHGSGLGEDERPLGLRLTRLEWLRDPAEPAAHDFSEGGEVSALALEGWHAPEQEGRWSDAAGATIRLPRPPGAGDRLRLALDGRVFGTAHGGPARVDLGLDGRTAAFLAFPDDGFRSQEVSLDCAEAEGTILLSLRRPGGVSPAEVGEGDDARRLGLLLRSLVVVWE